MKIYTKISVVFISLIILLSSTGILFVHHHCDHCNTDDWHLFSSINCESNVIESDCCSADQTDDCSGLELVADNKEQPCCSNDGLFFKLGIFNSNCETLIITNDSQSDINIVSHIFLDKIKSNSEFCYSDNSPPKLFKQIFLFINSFRI